MSALRTSLLLVCSLLLVGCETWFGDAEKPPLPGERISVLEHDRTLVPDPQARLEPVVLPPAQLNEDWPQAGGNPSHSMQNLQAGEIRRAAWTVSIGSGADDDRPLVRAPIVAGGRVFTLDTENVVRAFDARSGKRLWETDLGEEEDVDGDAGGGGLAFNEGRIFATTGFGGVFALDPSSGKELWKRETTLPIHTSPTAVNGRVFFVTVENQLLALNAVDGSDAWPPYQALSEMARITGGANPAVEGGVLIAPFSSGELVAMRADNGRSLWSDSLAPARRTDELSALAQIRARPVIDGGRVYAISVGGILAAFDMRSGRRLWDRDIGGMESPWLAGDQIFQVTADGQMACISAENGRIRWAITLPAFADEEEKKDPLLWMGPVLLQDRLIVVSKDGRLLAISPYDGAIIDRQTFSAGFSEAPVVADGTVYMVDLDGNLSAFR